MATRLLDLPSELLRAVVAAAADQLPVRLVCTALLAAGDPLPRLRLGRGLRARRPPGRCVVAGCGHGVLHSLSWMSHRAEQQLRCHAIDFLPYCRAHAHALLLQMTCTDVIVAKHSMTADETSVCILCLG